MRTPADFGLDYRDVALEADDGVRLHAWLVHPEVEPVGRVLYLHGNAQNVSYHLSLALWWVAAGYEVLALDYRGYGLSAGAPSIEGALRDIRAATGLLAERSAQDGLPRIVFGQSLGASLAVLALGGDARVREGVDALVIEAGFAHFGRVGREFAASFPPTWPLQWVPRLTLAPLVDPIDRIGSVGVPVVVVHSIDDRLVDIRHGRELHAAATGPARFVEAAGEHVRAAADPAVREAVLDFVREASGAAR